MRILGASWTDDPEVVKISAEMFFGAVLGFAIGGYVARSKLIGCTAGAASGLVVGGLIAAKGAK